MAGEVGTLDINIVSFYPEKGMMRYTVETKVRERDMAMHMLYCDVN